MDTSLNFLDQIKRYLALCRTGRWAASFAFLGIRAAKECSRPLTGKSVYVARYRGMVGGARWCAGWRGRAVSFIPLRPSRGTSDRRVYDLFVTAQRLERRPLVLERRQAPDRLGEARTIPDAVVSEIARRRAEPHN